MAQKNLILNRYRPLAKAGTGGFATVVAAFDTHLKRNVAIKVIDLDEFTAEQLAWSMGLKDTPPARRPDNRNQTEHQAMSPAEKAAVKRQVVLPWEDDPIEVGTHNETASRSDDALESDNAFGDDETVYLDEAPSPSEQGFRSDKDSRPAFHISATELFVDTDIDFPEDPTFLDNERYDLSRESLDNLPAATPSRLLPREEQSPTGPLPGLTEAQVAGNLGSPNIVAVYDIQLEGTTAYLIMEYVDGMSLAEFLEKHDADLTLDIVAAIVEGVSSALETAHRNDVLHLDIKPGNILIDKRGNIKVTDFGIAALPDAQGDRHGDGGTVGYMPLEQIDRLALDERCDEWALASVLYEMLSGGNPFRTETLEASRRAIFNAELVLPSLMWEDLDGQADEVLFYALEIDPEDRYETVGDFAEEIIALLGDPQSGREEIAALISPQKEPEAEEEAEAPREPRVPLSERLTPRAAQVAGRAFALVATALVMALGVLNMPLADTTMQLIAWAIVAAGSAASAFLPCIGPLVAFATLGGALIWDGHYIPAAVLIASTALWWAFAVRPRNAKAAPNIATGTVLAGAIGLAPIAPLASGYYLTVGKTAMTAALSFVVAVVLASLGSRDLICWMPWDFALFASTPIEATNVFIGLIVQPSTLLMGAAWILSAVAFSLFCSLGKRWLAVVGAILSGIILLAGVIAFQFFATNGASSLPTVWAVGAALISTAIAAGCASITIPCAPESTGQAL